MNANTRPHAPLALELELVDESGIYVAIGDLIDGKYRVEEVLGVGGMGFVLAATHVELEERFALKFLGLPFLDQPAILSRFTQEARAACRLRSEHIARVHDVGVHAGAPFIVMEHLVGRDLAAVVAARGALPVMEAVEYVMQACEALAVAHRRGIVHRDIKPENLFLVEQEGLPSVKLLDFGISKVDVTGDGRPTRRHTGNLTLGTPCYMAPEQIRSSADADARSDQWSLGVVLYELLAGLEAFPAPSVNEVCAAVLEREPPAIETLREDVPPGLVAVLRRCLAKSPDDRYRDVAELASALLPFAPSRALVSAERSSSLMRTAVARDVRVSAVRSSAEPTTDPPISHAPSTRSLAVAAPRRRWPIAVLATVAVLGLGVAASGARPWRVRSTAVTVPSEPVNLPVEETALVLTPTPPIAASPVSAQASELASAIPATVAAAPTPARRPVAVGSARTHVPIPSPSESAAPRASATATAAVELGY